jgi:hypothetical protein
MLRDPAAELFDRDTMTHGTTPARPERRVAHAEPKAHRGQDVLDLVEDFGRSSGLQHFAFRLLHELAQRPMFAFFRQLYDRTESSSSSTLLSRFSFDELTGRDGLQRHDRRLVEPTKIVKWSRISFAGSDTASRGVTAPLVQTSSVSLS